MYACMYVCTCRGPERPSVDRTNLSCSWLAGWVAGWLAEAQRPSKHTGAPAAGYVLSGFGPNNRKLSGHRRCTEKCCNEMNWKQTHFVCAGFPGFLPWGAGHMVKRSRFARRHNGSHAASAQSKVICLPLCFEGDPTCNHDSSSYKTRLQRTRNVRLAGKSPVGDTTSVILDSSKTLVASCTST